MHQNLIEIDHDTSVLYWVFIVIEDLGISEIEDTSDTWQLGLIIPMFA